MKDSKYSTTEDACEQGASDLNHSADSTLKSASILAQTILLMRLDFKNFYRINEVRYSGDAKLKRRAIGMSILFAFVTVYLSGLMGIVSYSLCAIGARSEAALILMSAASGATFFFSLFGAGAILFNEKVRDRLAPLPLSPTAIILSRIGYMLITMLGITLVIMLPSGIIYANSGVPFSAGLFYFISLPFVPVLPVVGASVIGTFIEVLSAGAKKHNGVKNLLSLLFITVVLVACFTIPASMESMSQADIVGLISENIGRTARFYPMLTMYQNALAGSFSAALLFILLSVGIEAVFTAVVIKIYMPVTRAVHKKTVTTGYTLTEQRVQSPLKALYSQELTRYFSYNLWVQNTLIGFIMMVLLAGALFFMRENTSGPFNELFTMGKSYGPYVLALCGLLGTTTSAAVSAEGKQWGTTASLPISMTMLVQSKVLADLTFAVPSCLLASTLLVLALGQSGFTAVMTYILPLAYIVFAAVVGLWLDFRHPNFDWDNIQEVVKQKASVMLMILIGFAACSIGMLIHTVLPFGDVLNVVLLITLTFLLYKKCCARRVSTVSS